MLHALTLGHLDLNAARQGKVAIVQPLDMNIVQELLAELGQVDADGQMWLGTARVRVHNGYLVCPWLGAGKHTVVEEFARRLQAEAGCILADIEHREIVELLVPTNNRPCELVVETTQEAEKEMEAKTETQARQDQTWPQPQTL